MNNARVSYLCVHRVRFLALPLLLIAVQLSSLFNHTAYAAQKKYWNLSPYRIHLHLAIDGRALPEPHLGEKILMATKERVLAALFPMWSMEYSLVEGPNRYKLLLGLENLDLETFVAPLVPCDKHMFLCVRATTTGYSLECREYDCYLRRWGPICTRQLRQRSMLELQCFTLLVDTFAPLATIKAIDGSEDSVTLQFKGCDLPRRYEEFAINHAQDVYQPLLVRTNASGEVPTNGVREVPWTYVTLEEQEEDRWRGRFHSGIGNPFRLRRRGRTQHIAIASRHRPNSSTIRFYPRHDAEQALSGYEVFRKDSKDEDSQLIGQTDVNGVIHVPPGNKPVSMLYLRSEGQLLVKIPVAPGAKSMQAVPVSDDPARLRAQAELTSLREQLIDLVARRSILMRRIRNQLKGGQIQEAKELYTVLADLPDLREFDEKLRSAKNNRLFRSDDAKIQGRIDKLFANVQKLLGGFLNAKELSDINREINSAARDSES